MAAGRPTLYDPKFCGIATRFFRLKAGGTNAELAEMLGVSIASVSKWLAEIPEFSEAVRSGKVESDAQVVNALYRRATGYTHPDTDIKMHMGVIIKTPIVKHFPPDVQAAQFWLKNRHPDAWKDKQEVEHKGGLTVALTQADVNLL